MHCDLVTGNLSASMMRHRSKIVFLFYLHSTVIQIRNDMLRYSLAVIDRESFGTNDVPKSI